MGCCKYAVSLALLKSSSSTSKLEKPKKEKKPRVIEKTKPLPKVPVFLIMLVGLSLVVLIILLSSQIGYSLSIARAKEYYEQGNYVESYSCFNQGEKVKEVDEELFNKARLTAYLQQPINSYQASPVLLFLSVPFSPLFPAFSALSFPSFPALCALSPAFLPPLPGFLFHRAPWLPPLKALLVLLRQTAVVKISGKIPAFLLLTLQSQHLFSSFSFLSSVLWLLLLTRGQGLQALLPDFQPPIPVFLQELALQN